MIEMRDFFTKSEKLSCTSLKYKLTHFYGQALAKYSICRGRMIEMKDFFTQSEKSVIVL